MFFANSAYNKHQYSNPHTQYEDDENSAPESLLGVELTSKTQTNNPKIITKEIHIKPFQHTSAYYSSRSDYCKCLYCDLCDILSGIALSIAIIIGLSILVAIVLGILYGGYLVVLEGINVQQYANTFDIRGECVITKAETEESESCTRDSEGNEDCSTSYTAHYDFEITANNNFTIFRCVDGDKYSESKPGKAQYDAGDVVHCYTNDNCHDVFVDTANEHHTKAGWIFFGASLVFCVDCCCIVGFFVAFAYGIVYCCAAICMCFSKCQVHCICYEYYKSKKNANIAKYSYYSNSWNEIKSKKQCDYVLGYWTRKQQVSFGSNVITDDILAIIVKYCG